jgi:hypothetical protein
MSKVNSNFKTWLRHIWLENCDEHDQFNEPAFNMSEYFQKYKWWLRREYRHQSKS